MIRSTTASVIVLASSAALFWTRAIAQTVESSNASAIWTNESHLAVVVTTGNTETDSYAFRHATEVKRGANTGKVGGSFYQANGRNVQTGGQREIAHRWDAFTRYERGFTPAWTGYVAYEVESNKFARIRQRHNSDVGAKYLIVQRDRYNVLWEAGLRYVHVNYTDTTQDHYPAGRAYIEANYRMGGNSRAKFWAEYVSNLEDESDYNINYEASVTSELTSILSLRVAYLSKTDNLPAANAEKTDTTLTTALVARF